MTTKAAADWLNTVIESDLAVTCKKGEPAWDRPDLATGAYIMWNTTDPNYGQRASASLDVWGVAFDVVVVCASEVALWAMIDLVETMAESRTAATISSVTNRVRFGSLTRAPNPYETEAMRYALATTITFMR